MELVSSELQTTEPRATYIVASENTDNLAAAVQLDEQSLVEVLR